VELGSGSSNFNVGVIRSVISRWFLTIESVKTHSKHGKSADNSHSFLLIIEIDSYPDGFAVDLYSRCRDSGDNRSGFSCSDFPDDHQSRSCHNETSIEFHDDQP